MLCAKPCGKRLLLSPEKSSEGTLYSVPSFGGHIAISHDVTVYPFLVMARTVNLLLTEREGRTGRLLYSTQAMLGLNKCRLLKTKQNTQQMTVSM